MSKHVAVLAKKRSTRKVLVGATTIGIDLGGRAGFTIDLSSQNNDFEILSIEESACD